MSNTATAEVRRMCIENILSMLSSVRVSQENAERNLEALELYKLVEMYACLVHICDCVSATLQTPDEEGGEHEKPF